MSAPVIYVKDPILNDYSDFFQNVLLNFPNTLPKVEIHVGKHVQYAAELNFILLTLYTQIRSTATNLGFTYKFEIDILVNRPEKFDDREIFCVETEVIAASNVHSVKAEIRQNQMDTQLENGLQFNSVGTCAVGGTFDHMHDAHKILLTMTAFTSRTLVIIGVTGPKLLVNKKYAEVMEPLHERVMKVVRFLQTIKPEICFEIYQINDVCGPTGFVDAIDALVVSEETSKGGSYVNEYRAERNFKALEIITVKVIGNESSSAENSWKGKLSSTDIREAEYKTLHP